MSKTVRLRLSLPEGGVGEVVALDDVRADELIKNGYAVSEKEPTPAVTASLISLPGPDALKEEWEKAAIVLGIDVTDKTKPEIIEEVKKATD